jgi:hypothetical protein
VPSLSVPAYSPDENDAWKKYMLLMSGVLKDTRASKTVAAIMRITPGRPPRPMVD